MQELCVERLKDKSNYVLHQHRVNNCWWRRIVFSPERTQKAIPCTAIEPINDAEPQSLAASIGRFNFPPHYLHTFGRALSRLVLRRCKKSEQKPKQLSLNPFQSWEAPTSKRERRSPRASNNKWARL
jgi:hypothetical protein